MGTFGTVFLLILFSFIVCLCKRTRRGRHPSKNIKGSVSFNDQEKKLLDLSITTTNDRGDSCGIDNNTPSINKTESVIAFEPIEITVENRSGGIGGGGLGTVSAAGCASSSVIIGGGGGGGMIQSGGVSGNNALVTGGGAGTMIQHEEFPLNVGVFPPPPEFRSNVVANPAYGNIFISVSVTQDMLDSSDINIYPDLLNIPKRIDNNTTMLPVNVSSFATLPRNHSRRGILKKDTTATNLYPHDEIVSYHNLDTSSYAPTVSVEQQQQQQQPTSRQSRSSTSKASSTCINCMKSQPHPYVKDESTAVTTTRQCSVQTPSCLKYDNMGRRITASGNSTLSLPDEEQLENETLFNESNPLRTFNIQTSGSVVAVKPQPTQTTSTTTTTTSTKSDCLEVNSDFVSL